MKDRVTKLVRLQQQTFSVLELRVSGLLRFYIHIYSSQTSDRLDTKTLAFNNFALENKK